MGCLGVSGNLEVSGWRLGGVLGCIWGVCLGECHGGIWLMSRECLEKGGWGMSGDVGGAGGCPGGV